MGFACPVCDAPQVDAEHLANHLAFSAMLGRDDHEAYLDEHAPGWAEMGPEDLAPTVADLAPERDLPDEGSGSGGGDHVHRFEDELARGGGYGRDTAMDAETERVVDEARELTAEMYGVADGDGGAAGDGEDAVDGTDGGGGDAGDADSHTGDARGGTGDAGGDGGSSDGEDGGG